MIIFENEQHKCSLLTAFGGNENTLAWQVAGSTFDFIFVMELGTGIGASGTARLEASLSRRADVETVSGGHPQVVHGSGKVLDLWTTFEEVM